MILVDTSVWISHLRDGNTELENLLNNGFVLCHPLIVGELACGNLKDRAVILSFLKLLPMSIEAEHEEVFSFIENKRLMGKGIGYVDAQLIASAALTGVPIWTLDKNLAQVADGLHIKYKN
ncbi:MAG: type II toxin-antitoxin system VapC family toxin [Deltaproteobacteria bacterium]|nr:type II toxin-antitoxin system VapC family toxin [Deltaproteobacteria bacterium]